MTVFEETFTFNKFKKGICQPMVEQILSSGNYKTLNKKPPINHEFHKTLKNYIEEKYAAEIYAEIEDLIRSAIILQNSTNLKLKKLHHIPQKRLCEIFLKEVLETREKHKNYISKLDNTISTLREIDEEIKT